MQTLGDRLKPRDLALLAGESHTTPMHNVTVEVFRPGPDGFEYQQLLDLIDDRIAFVPRYRQRLTRVPGRLANPIWMDDPEFDLGYHVRRSALPRPGSMEQLRELAARIVSRPLDRSRPLWEVYFVEGLEQGRVAVLAKSHQLLVDGIRTVDLGQVLLDLTPEVKRLEPDPWHPGPRPGPMELVTDAVRDTAANPAMALTTLRTNLEATWRTAAGAASRADAVLRLFAQRRTDLDSPLNGPLSQQRRVVTLRTDLADYREIRRDQGGTVNDVILATIAGGLRAWLMTRSESLGGVKRLHTLVPMSVIDDELEATSLGTQIAAHHVELPVGEPNPLVRLHQVTFSFRSHWENRRAVAADRLAGIAGFAPTTFHALGSRVAAAEHHRTGFHLSVTNVPGPQFPLYAAGAQMTETYPVHPLLPGQQLAIGVTSYDGGVFYGITADRDAVPDADLLSSCLKDALDELLEAGRAAPVRPARARPKRSRGARSAKRPKRARKD